MLCSISLFFLLAVLWPLQLVGTNCLSSFGIKSYRVIRAIHDETDTHRRKRTTNEEGSQRILKFELDHENITLILNNAREFFAPHADIQFDATALFPMDSTFLYEGYVSGQRETSYVTGGFYSNSFDGIIKLSNATWHIEPARKYGMTLRNVGPSIIYNALDVDLTKHNRTEAFRYETNVIDKDDELSSSFSGLSNNVTNETMRQETHNDDKSDFLRVKRQITTPERTCCYIYIRIDPTLWNIVYENEGLNEKEASIHALVTLVYRTVTAANSIYRPVNFKYGDDALRQFTLRIKRIRILTNESCEQKNLSLSETHVCRPYLDSNVLLTWHSAENFEDYCLAYLFTARDFGDGTLGLAWMGSISPNNRGGICERSSKDIYEGQRIIKTVNTGVITVINHHTRISGLMTELTFAHEVGHSLGAEHDDDICGGDATHGFYIMYRRATTGLEGNNNKFSNCSIEKMAPVMISVKNQLHGKVNCLTECSRIGYCGNRNVEDDEECDCGFRSECTDICCYPADEPNTTLGCKLKPGARCSPSRGPCCSDQCTLHSTTHICHKDKTGQECIGDVRCDGMQAVCPMNDTRFFKLDDTPCNQNTALCHRGECNKSICTSVGKTECILTIPGVVDPLRQREVNREYLCHIGCLDTRTNLCVDTHELRMPNNQSSIGYGYKYRPGHACAGTAGYCDVFGKCRAVDAEGPLTRLKNKLLNKENISLLNDICRHYWWALLLGLSGLIGLMSIFVKLCSVHTPSSNPNLNHAQMQSFRHESHSRRSSRPFKTLSDLNRLELDFLQQRSASTSEALTANYNDGSRHL